MHCTHHWLLEVPRGGIVLGHCRYCEQRYRRREMTYGNEWNRRVVQARHGPDPVAAINAW